MSFGSPLLLLALLLVPIVAGLAVLLSGRRARYPVAFTNVEILRSVHGSGWSRKAWIPLVLLLLALAFAATALARPRVVRSTAQDHAVIVMLVDVSGSMAADDIKPTRIQAAVQAMQTFVDKLPTHAEVGLVEFSTVPTVIEQPTEQHEDVTSALEYLLPQGATALGDGIAAAVNVAQYTLRDEDAHRDGQGFEPAAIVLLSDGAQNRGTLTPEAAAGEAKAAGIRVYSIAFGTPHGTMRFGEGPGGLVPVPPDPETMRQVAAITGGQMFEAQNAGQATSIYQGLGSAIARTSSRQELDTWFSLAAGLLLLGALGTGLVLGQVLP